MAAETRDIVVLERPPGTSGHGLENKSHCGWETAILSLGTLGYTSVGLIICPDTQSQLGALPQLRRSPQDTVVGKGARGEWSVSPGCKFPDSIQTGAAEQGLGARALLRIWSDCQDRVWTVQRSHHLHKEQRFGQRDLGEARENHDWDEGHTH